MPVGEVCIGRTRTCRLAPLVVKIFDKKIRRHLNCPQRGGWEKKVGLTEKTQSWSRSKHWEGEEWANSTRKEGKLDRTSSRVDVMLVTWKPHT